MKSNNMWFIVSLILICSMGLIFILSPQEEKYDPIFTNNVIFVSSEKTMEVEELYTKRIDTDNGVLYCYKISGGDNTSWMLKTPVKLNVKDQVFITTKRPMDNIFASFKVYSITSDYSINTISYFLIGDIRGNDYLLVTDDKNYRYGINETVYIVIKSLNK